LTFTFVKRLSRRKEPSFLFMGYQHEWRYLWIFPSYFIGTEPYGNCTVFRPKNKTNDLLYPKRLTLAEIYIGHTPVTHLAETEPVQSCIWNIDGQLLKDLWAYLMWTQECWQSRP
jgi:hypothetical protein